MFRINSKFIGDFKVGDNINHNLKILALLYGIFENGNPAERNLLCKPITVILISIIEAVLWDLHLRMRKYTREGVSGLSKNVLDYVRRKQIDQLEKYINSARKHRLFPGTGLKIYNELHELRKLRNRIHIQNTKGDFESDESDAFSETRKTQAEQALEKIMRSMASYERDGAFKYVEDFVLPWKAHFE